MDRYIPVCLKYTPTITDSRYQGHLLTVRRVSLIKGVDCISLMKKSAKGLPCFHTAIKIQFSTYHSTYSLTVIMVLFVMKCNISSQEPIMSTVEGQYLMSEYRQFSHAGEKIADMVYFESQYYLCLLQSQRLAQVSFM